MPTREHIRTDIVRHLAWDDRVDVTHIIIEIDEGRITLRGNVPSHVARRAAEEDVLAVTGVQAVDNQLAVEYGDVPGESDGEIADNIQRMLRWNPSLMGAVVDVVVDDGRVVLRGKVDAYWKKKRIEFLVDDMIGVKAVTNELRVIPTAQIIDERIAEDIRAALQRNIHVNDASVDIQLDAGTVTLAGEVENVFAYRNIYDTVYHTPGVIEINDQLHIRSSDRPNEQ